MDQAKGRRAFFFVLVLVLVTALVMGAVLALNVVADPYGSVGTHLFPTVTTSDRTVKADSIEALKEPPELVVLGSSRSMRYEPSYLEKKTGLRTFNAGVNGIGGTADAWAMTQFIHEMWPDAHPAYLWLVDVESFVPFEVQARTANEPRLAKYVGAATAGKGPRRAGQGDLAEPHHAVLARHRQGLGAPAPLPRQGQEQPEQVPQADPRRRRAQAAPVEQEGVEAAATPTPCERYSDLLQERLPASSTRRRRRTSRRRSRS